MVRCVQDASSLHDFLREQRLPLSFLKLVDEWYVPLAGRIAKHRDDAGRPLLIGINGSQGSGKSTLAALLTELLTKHFGLKTIDLSIDDFYLSREARLALAGRSRAQAGGHGGNGFQSARV